MTWDTLANEIYICSSSNCPKNKYSINEDELTLTEKYGGKCGFSPLFLSVFLFLLAIVCFNLQRYLSWCFEMVKGVSAFSACAAAEKRL